MTMTTIASLLKSGLATLVIASAAGNSLFARAQTTYDFIKLGDGFCRDSNDELHEMVVFRNANFNDPLIPDDCKALCGACPGQGQTGMELRGFWIGRMDYDMALECQCMIDKGGTFDNTVCNNGNGRDVVAITGDYFQGTGEITNLSHSAGECYKIPATVTEAPTSSPTSAPTVTNSKAGKRSSKAPKVIGLTTLQAQQMASGGSFVTSKSLAGVALAVAVIVASSSYLLV